METTVFVLTYDYHEGDGPGPGEVCYTRWEAEEAVRQDLRDLDETWAGRLGDDVGPLDVANHTGSHAEVVDADGRVLVTIQVEEGTLTCPLAR